MNPTVVAAWIAAGVSVLTLIGTLAAQYLGYRATSKDAEKTAEKQRQDAKEQRKYLDRTITEQRTASLNERFATAAEQLGSDKPAVRLAGVYAMAGLADDWEESRQTCVDVLCAYLRMPYEPDPGQDAPEVQQLAFQANREVRHTVIRVITVHLKEDAAVSWQGLNFDFTGVVFDGGDFTGARFSSGAVNFRGARFSAGTVSFRFVRFSGGEVDFEGAWFSGGMVDFIRAEFTGGKVFFYHAVFSGARVIFDATFSGSMLGFSSARFSGGWVSFGEAEFSGGEVGFALANFSAGTVDFQWARFSGALVTFQFAKFCGGTVDFGLAVFSGGVVNFVGAEFTGGVVGFSSARFSGGAVRFVRAEFSGGTVDFSNVDDWSFPPKFPWTGEPPSGVTLPHARGKAN